MSAAYVKTTMSKSFHNAVVDWQQRNFDDYDFMIKNWSKYYRQEPFELCAKIGKSVDVIEIGRRKGRQKFDRAHDMKGNMFYQSAAIVKAQASTEFGSIQQHRDTLDLAIDDETRFDMLRIMAEELRHGYQMAWIFDHDDWVTGGADLGKESIEELLAMEMGSHVLDSFNIPFQTFLDNIIYASIIDRVGKYQLTMQQVFSYKPMSASMGPMLQEESFHMASGVNPLRKIARKGADGKGKFSIAIIQQHLNKWFARALEMFGNEEGGTTNVDYGFKSMKNGEAALLYALEVQSAVIDPVNREIIKVRKDREFHGRKEAKALADEIIRTREGKPGIGADEILYLPDVRYFRRRGVYAFTLIDPRGEEVKTPEACEQMLLKTLPDEYEPTEDLQNYFTELRAHHAGVELSGSGAGFRL